MGSCYYITAGAAAIVGDNSFAVDGRVSCERRFDGFADTATRSATARSGEAAFAGAREPGYS